MILYAVKIDFLEQLECNVSDEIEKHLCEHLIIHLNEKYSVSHKINCSKEKYGGYFVAVDDASWIHDFLCESKSFLQSRNVKFSYKVSLTDVVDFIPKSDDCEIQDAVDYLGSFVRIDSDLARDGYIITELPYVHMIEDIICNVTLKARSLDKLGITLICELDEDELENITNIISWLDDEYNSIICVVKKFTKEKE